MSFLFYIIVKFYKIFNLMVIKDKKNTNIGEYKLLKLIVIECIKIRLL